MYTKYCYIFLYKYIYKSMYTKYYYKYLCKSTFPILNFFEAYKFSSITVF